MQRQVKNFKADHGRVQIVETANGGCHVGYLPSEEGATWRHWGAGEGGYDATVKRFAMCSTFNPTTIDGD